MIFIASLASIDSVIALLYESSQVIEFVKELGFVLGMGGVTAAIFLFWKFVRDFRIDENELRVLKGISELVWLGVALVLVAQMAMFVSSAGILASSVFIAQTLVIFIAAICGAILMIIFAPFLEVIPFGDTKRNQTHPSIIKLRRPLFVTGTIMITSWYFAFVLDYVGELNLWNLITIYTVILLISTLMTLIRARNLGASL